MRGKLRDKRVDLKREPFKRQVVDRRRPLSRRENRSQVWLNQQLQEEDDYLIENEAEDELNAPEQSVQPAQPIKSAQPAKPAQPVKK
jgi:hypothetical protein